MAVGDRVRKVGGDYRFEGVLVARFLKRDGTSMRIVIENDDGVLHIFNVNQVELVK